MFLLLTYAIISSKPHGSNYPMFLRDRLQTLFLILADLNKLFNFPSL